MPDDLERPPVAHHVIGGPPGEGWTHNESLEGTRAAAYPFLLVTCHPRWREHAQTNDAAWLREIPWCKLRGPDGYMYEPAWIHPTDAAAKGIVTGDIVKIYNDRGIVLGGAIVTERIMPGAIWQDHGAPIDIIRDSDEGVLGIDRSGSNNMIAMRWGVSQNCTGGMASSGYLVQFEKLSLDEMEQWKKDYPDAFARKYDYDSGPCFDAWVVDEGGTK
jgi:anaerobic selenocysteine-containing dehydrogenase